MIGGFVRPIFAAIPAAVICYLFSLRVTKPSWPFFGIEVLTVAATTAVVNFYVCLTPAQRKLAAEKLQGLRYKLRPTEVVGH